MTPFHHLLFIIACTIPTHALYNIDDGNSSVRYSVGSIGWDHKDPGVPNNSADASRCYDQTYTVNHFLCTDSDGCYIQIPFTGSGITIYAIQSPDPVSARMTIDGQSASVHSLDPIGVFQYNVLLYDLRSLNYADHTLDIALVNYVYTNGTSMGSLIRLDYAAINDDGAPGIAQPSPGSSSGSSSGSSTSPTSSPSPGPTPSPSPGPKRSHSVIAIALGSTIGAIAVIVLAILAILCCRGRGKYRDSTEIHNGPMMAALPIDPYTPYGNSAPATFSQPAHLNPDCALLPSSSPTLAYGLPQSSPTTSRNSDAPLISSARSGVNASRLPFSPGNGQRISDVSAAALLWKDDEVSRLSPHAPYAVAPQSATIPLSSSPPPRYDFKNVA